jgi:hypothetical protein
MTQKSSRSNSLLTRALRAGVAGIGSLALFAGMSSGCLDRPVAPAQPSTTNIFVDQIIQTAVDKIDLLFMIDNSRSMADKQRILQDAVPQLLNRLINPACFNPDTEQLSNPPCGPGTEQEFKPIDDIHIGIVTSSLGGHGADTCSQDVMYETQEEASQQDDKGQLLPTLPRRDGAGNPVNLPQYNGNSGFLVWDPSNKHTPPGEGTEQTLVQNFTTQVSATGELGCGFEASLEAWYRFLIDPDPPQNVVKMGNEAIVQRPNQAIIQQRRAFLRPDSLVAVIMLTDENDCSTFDGGIAWLAGQGSADGGFFTLPRATAACQSNPNSNCCRSCRSEESAPPAGCDPLGSDPGCAQPFHSVESDPLNLRCWDQKRRYGVDFLYGVGRYIEGLTSPTIHNFEDRVVPNPLYMDLSGNNQPGRDAALVFLAGIIGVPWQDIATEETLPATVNDLKYMTAREITREGRWAMILGDPGATPPKPPTDALMFESPYDRTTLQGLNTSHPLGLGNLVPATGPIRGNPMNGNEFVPGPGAGPARDDDLQYACIFPLGNILTMPRQCGSTQGCDCSTNDQGLTTDGRVGKPLCNGTEQTYAKAYPGLRHLQVLKGIGEQVPQVNNAIVASICPKITDRSNPAYGYNPAVAAIIERLKEQLGGKCLPRPLDVDEAGNVKCAVVEATLIQGGGCQPCDNARNRSELIDDKAALIDPVRARLASLDRCGGDTNIACEDFCMCEITPAQGTARDVCLSDPAAVNAGNNFGYCYVDPKIGLGTDELVSACPASQKRKLQFIGQNTPAKGSVAFIACLGSTVTDTGDSGL